MKVATWNVNSLNARLPRVLQLLAEHRPDIVCLQETKCYADAFPRAALTAAGYEAADHSGGRWAGVAILAPRGTPPTDVRAGLEGETAAEECRWVEATVAGIRVASVYVPNGRAPGTPTFAQKLAFLESMARRVASLAGRPLLVAGDCNVARSDADVYDPAAFVGSTHVTPDERGRLEAVLAAGLVDAYRRLHPDGSCFTWWDYRAGAFHRNLGLRIDLLLLSPDLAARLSACGIARDYRKGAKPSDHAPLVAELT